MKRREFIIALTAAFVAGAAKAEPQNKVWRIGVLDTTPRQSMGIQANNAAPQSVNFP